MARLRIVGRDALTISRRKVGSGYGYVAADGTRCSDVDLRKRARAMGIPPAWTEVKIASDPRAHIQACGMDAAGRMQYIYHPDWEARRTHKKQKQLALLTDALPRIRRHVASDLGAEPGSKPLALAIGVALIDRTAMRVGRERYLDAHGTRGAGTLFTRDVSIKSSQIKMAFPAKSGKRANYLLDDATLSRAIAGIKQIPGKRLLMYRDADGAPKSVRSEEINRYLREISGTSVTAKDFRTLHGSALAGDALARLEPGPSASARKRQMAAVTRSVAAFLQNTPAVTRKSYIAPCLFALFDRGELAPLWSEASDRRDGLRQREIRLNAVLEAKGRLVPA